MALDAVHATAAQNTLSLDEEDFDDRIGNGGGVGGGVGGGRSIAPLASLGPGVAGAGACTLGSNDFDDEREIDEHESDLERKVVLRFLGGGGGAGRGAAATAKAATAVGSSSSSSSVISSAMLVAAASGAAPSPWLTLEEEADAAATAAAAAAAGERGREAVGV